MKYAIIGIALFCMALLVGVIFVNNAYAVEGVHSVTGMTLSDLITYNGGANTYIAWTASSATIEKISPTTFTRTTATLPASTAGSLGFDCSLTQDVCVYTTATGNLIKAVTASGTQLWSRSPASSATAGSGFVDIIESLGVVIVTVTCNGNNNRIGQEFELATGTYIKDVGACAGTIFSNNVNTISALYVSDSEYAITLSGSGFTGNFQIWNIGNTPTSRVCSWSTVSTLSGSEGDIVKLGSTYYISDGTSLQAITGACADGTDITSTNHGMSTVINVFKSTVRSEYYVSDTTGFAIMNSSNITQKIGEVTCSTSSASQPIAFADEFIQAGCFDSGANIVTVIQISNISEEDTDTQSGSSNGVCLNVDANGDGRVNVLDCVGSATAWSGFTAGRNATDIASSITDGLGLTNCGEDGLPKECGSGLYMFVFLLLLLEFLVLAGYLGFTSKMNADKQIVDVAILMFMVGFVGLAIAFYSQWIPDVVFYALVVLIAGLLTFGLIKKFG